MGDEAVMAAILESPWERMAAHDVGGVAAAVSLRSPMAAVEALLNAPVPVFEEGEISEAFDDIIHERTIRVSTDIRWSLDSKE